MLFFADGKNIKEALSDIKFSKISERRLGTENKLINNFGDLSVSQVDINSDQKIDDLYKLEGWFRFFEGNILFYFFDDTEQEEFLDCALNEKCTAKIAKSLSSESRSIGDFVKEMKEEWSSINIIHAGSTEKDIRNSFKTEVDPFFSYSHPMKFGDRMYIHTKLTHQGSLPAEMVAIVDAKNKIQKVCTYRRGARW